MGAVGAWTQLSCSAAPARTLGRCTSLLQTRTALPAPDPQAEPRAEAEAAALRALAALRLRSKRDCLPARVAPGLFIGGAGAARNLKALRKRGITHIVNAAPAVPCHFRDNPEGAFEYLALPLFDDADAGAGWRAGAEAAEGVLGAGFLLLRWSEMAMHSSPACHSCP